MLPKGAEVEWQATWGVPPSPVEDDDEDDDAEGRGASSSSETWAAVSTGASALVSVSHGLCSLCV